MVRVINIDTKNKTIHVCNEDKIDWITVKGTHVPIKEGESKGEAVKDFFKKHVVVTGLPESKKESQPAKKEAPKKEKKERDWWRGPRESEDAYFDRRDKTLAEARKIDKVSDWYAKAFKGDDDGLPTNKNITFKELADGLLSGKIKDFYETVGTGESDVREKIFEELSERTGRPYDDFYDAWLYGGTKGTPARVQKQKESIEYMDKLLKVGELDPELKRLIINARDRAKKELKK